MELKNKKSGFTLFEVMIAFIILGILSAMALPRFTGTLERTRAAEGVQILTAYIKAQKIYRAEHGAYLTHFGGPDAFLDITAPNSSYFTAHRIATGYLHPGPIFWVRRENAYFLGMTDEGTVVCEEFIDPETGLPLIALEYTCAQAGY